MKKFITNVNPKSYKSTTPKGVGEKNTQLRKKITFLSTKVTNTNVAFFFTGTAVPS
jgi:hypothetical protein